MRNKRQTPKINAGSMADIAFLLLIFWLVATTITPEYGWKNDLKNKEDEPKIAVVTNSADLVRVFVKEDGTYQLNGEDASFEKIEAIVFRTYRRVGFKSKLILSSDYDSSYESYARIQEMAGKIGIKILYNEI